MQPSVKRNYELDETWFSELTAKYLKNYCALDYPLQHIRPGAAAKHHDVVHGG